jgi:DNA modification methylase
MDNKKIDLGARGIYSLNNKLNNLTGKEWVKFTKSWTIINPKRRKEDTILHPAKFPEELVSQFISFFTKENEIVFDPFLGTGSTLVASKEINRFGIGIELNIKYSNIAKKRLEPDNNKSHFVINGDSLAILSKKNNKINNILNKLNSKYVDFIITSPPYWDMLKNSRGNIKTLKKIHLEKGGDDFYSDLKEDFGNMTEYNQYMDNLTLLFSNSYDLLKPNGYLVIIIQNIRVKEGSMIPVAWELAIRLSKKYKLKQEKLWLQDNKSLNIWGYPSTYVSNVHHHYCLVFQK